eukprot:528932_1
MSASTKKAEKCEENDTKLEAGEGAIVENGFTDSDSEVEGVELKMNVEKSIDGVIDAISAELPSQLSLKTNKNSKRAATENIDASEETKSKKQKVETKTKKENIEETKIKKENIEETTTKKEKVEKSE